MASFVPGVDGSTSWTIYTGTWVNWQQGSWLGTTLTTSNQYGLVLVSFIALFVGTLSGHTWGIICYVVHQVRTSRKAEDGLYHQTQILLRNSQSPSATLWGLANIGWAWRGRVRLSMWRVLVLIIIAAVQIAFFAVAGITSSEIFTSSNQVLLRSQHCGYIFSNATNYGAFTETEFAIINAQFIEAKTASDWSWNYALTCYGDNPSASCQYLAAPKIVSTYTNVTCPFASEMCLDPSSQGTVQADSGYINTDLHLGINSEKKNSIDYRRVTTCAPLQRNGFITTEAITTPGALPGEVDSGFNYGSAMTVVGENITHETYTYVYSPQRINISSVPYAITYSVAFLNNTGDSDWVPISQLNRTDADVTLIFVTNNAEFTSPTTDLWFDAQVEKPQSNAYFGGSYYVADPPVIVMGCTEQHQMCDPNLPRDKGCSPLTGWYVLGELDLFTGKQLAIQQELYLSIGQSMLNQMVFSLGIQALLASLSLDTPNGLYSNPLPPDHWKSEVQAWQSYSLAHIQKLVVDVASGPSNPEFNQYVLPPSRVLGNDSTIFDICNNIKIRDARYYSFSVLGLTLTILIGSLIMLTNLSLSSCVGWYQRTFHKGLERKEDWELDGVLQVQRMAYEAAKLGTWTNTYGDVPITIKALGDQKFGKPGRGKGMYEAVEMEPRRESSASARSGKRVASTYSAATVAEEDELQNTMYGEYMGPMDEVFLVDYARRPQRLTREFV